jgi:tRNA/tmRNA/rRNA uracil-C5-methylase (TrmA/RlmC/RlmD family)
MTSVESFRQATDDATLNLSDLPKVKAVCAPVERFLNEKVGNLDKGGKTASPRNSTVVLDPPRSGAGAKVVDQLLKIAPKHVVYVACDPIALARDLKQFLAGGYELKQLRAFDLFPHTHHVECVASLVRKA